jgi:hypothetical protein
MDLDLPKAGVEAVDEASTKIVPELEPILDSAIQKLLDGLRSILVGRTITITIK